MKIGLIGAPGSGKSEIGRRLVIALNKDEREKNPEVSIQERHRWRLVDEYVPRLADRTGRAYGLDGDIPHNIQIMSTRWTEEAEALYGGFHTVTCGTIYETMIYAALTRLLPPADEQGLMRFTWEARTTMQFMALMEEMTFNYDVLFYLPLESEERDWPQVIDSKIGEILEGRQKYAVPLTQKTTRQKVVHALEAVRAVRDLAEVEVAPDLEPTI